METLVKSPSAHSLSLDSLREVENIQALCSAYGNIARYSLPGLGTVVVKHVKPPPGNTSIQHQRKIKSYEVETNFYRNFCQLLCKGCRIPSCLGIEKVGDEIFIVLEDLRQAGYQAKTVHDKATDKEIFAVLSFLARFHVSFLRIKPTLLWEKGTFWHVDTRPVELQALQVNLVYV